MIHYHGLPIWPTVAAAEVLNGRHAFISYRRPDQLQHAIECCQSFAVDNGAFSAWKSGEPVEDWRPFYDWVESIKRCPGFDFAVIPDVIDGDEIQNDDLINEWPHTPHESAPVWHMHESIERLYDLAHKWPRVCIGSSGAFARVGSPQWWARMDLAMAEICDANGQPPCKIHGLRMLNPAIFTRLPLASADSTNIALTIGRCDQWKGTNTPPDRPWRARILAARIESHNSAPRWTPPEQPDLFTGGAE